MAKIEDEVDLYSIFSKRCASLHKKASDMIGKYDIDVPYAQGSEPSRLNIANTQIRIKEKQVELDNLEIIEEILTNQTTDETDIEEMWEQIKEFNPEDLKKTESRLDEVDLMLKNVAASFAQAPQENAN
ncbi:hypothetical protein KY289_035416 [Solanum tuberosum]|nr:hypothetical protein KY289_035416 [Solanum tuberosum]